jgi:hypothetical protein
VLQRLLEAHTVIEKNLDTAAMLSEHAEKLPNCMNVPAILAEQFNYDIVQYQRRLASHLREIKKNLQYGEHIRVLVTNHRT